MADKQYHKRSTAEVSAFMGTLTDAVKTNTGTFDSAAASSYIKEAKSSSTVKVPPTLQAVFDSVEPKEQVKIVQAILDGANTYKAEHGQDIPADVIEQALHSAYSTTPEGQRAALDAVVGTSTQSTTGYQSNRAIVSILTTTTEAIPFVHYLPADISSNQARLGIMTHTTGSQTGSYISGSIIDGAYSGRRYISSARDHVLKLDESGAYVGRITAIQITDNTCDQNASPVKLVRGSAIVYVNGFKVAQEVNSAGYENSPIAGSAYINNVTYAISGAVNTNTGEVKLNVLPALPASLEVLVEAFIDYERDSSLTPSIITTVEMYDLFANSWRATTTQSIDSRTQMMNELGLDSYSEGVIAIQAQFSNERHYDVIRKAKRIAINNSDTFDFNWKQMGLNKGRGEIWNDFSAVLGAVSQKMAIRTMNNGVTHLYVGNKVAAQMQGLPLTIWQPSGVRVRAGIYRIGRLFNVYDVYYTPQGVFENAEAAEILCLGQANDVTRNAFILGDAVSPTVIPLSTGADLKSGAGYYARNFTTVNPHQASAQGAALITVTNLF